MNRFTDISNRMRKRKTYEEVETGIGMMVDPQPDKECIEAANAINILQAECLNLRKQLEDYQNAN